MFHDVLVAFAERRIIIMETIRPSLRNHYNEISKQCREERMPVIITVNGRGDTVVLGLQDYYQMKSELELLRTLSEAEEDKDSSNAGFL